ncbi:hypothetical protein [Actinomadura gamaensis]|uniref:Uncharacterized protein n=1 Tax=Actinomadura gamaensis TaxID=1763541 RepID=A0ABV9U4H2_9ACTN
MPEPDEIRPADAAADPAPAAAPPSFGHDEPAPAGGELRIPPPFRLQAPWWAAESTDSDEPEPEEPARPGVHSDVQSDVQPDVQSDARPDVRPEAPAHVPPHAEAVPEPPHAPTPDDRLVAGLGAPDVDSRRAVPRPQPPSSRPVRDTVPDGTPVHPLPDGTGPHQVPDTPQPVPSPQSSGTGPQPVQSGGTGPQSLPPLAQPDGAEVPRNSGIAPPGGTGPQPTVEEPRFAIAQPSAMPLPAPVTGDAPVSGDAAADLAARTDSRTSGPVLTPDAILPPGVTLPPAVALPTVERTVQDAPKQPKQGVQTQDAQRQDAPTQDAPVTVTDIPAVQPGPGAAQQSPQAGATATAVAPRPVPGPSGPNDGNTGPQPFPPGPLGGERPGSLPNKRKRLLIGGSVAAAVIAVCGIAVAGIVSGGDDGGKAKKHRSAHAPGAPASPSAPVHHPVDINTEKTDPKPLALTEVFPSPTIQLGGRTFQRDRSSVNHQCGLTSRGSMAAALAREGCRSVVRVTFVSGDKKFAVTSGVAVLPNHDAALKVSRSGDPGRYEWFRGLTGPHSPDIDATGGYAAATVRGRYVAYAYATYTDGTRITPQDTQIKTLAQQFLDYGTQALDARARG